MKSYISWFQNVQILTPKPNVLVVFWLLIHWTVNVAWWSSCVLLSLYVTKLVFCKQCVVLKCMKNSHCDFGKWCCNEAKGFQMLTCCMGMNVYICGKCAWIFLLGGAFKALICWDDGYACSEYSCIFQCEEMFTVIWSPLSGILLG